MGADGKVLSGFPDPFMGTSADASKFSGPGIGSEKCLPVAPYQPSFYGRLSVQPLSAGWNGGSFSCIGKAGDAGETGKTVSGETVQRRF